MEGLVFDNHFEVMPFVEKRGISDLTTTDVEVLLNSLADIELHITDIVEDLPTGFSRGLELLRKKLEAADILVHWHWPCSKCLIHCRLISFSLARSS